MKLILIALLFCSQLIANNILSHKVYERSDRTDLLLTFDTPYNGRISQKKNLNKTTLLLYDTQYTQQVSKTLATPFLGNFSIVPQNNRTAIILSFPEDVNYEVSKTVDNYGLRLRFTQKKGVTSQKQVIHSSTKKSDLPTKAQTSDNSSYIFIVLVLFFCVLLLLFIKKRVQKSGNSKSWLFKNTNSSNEQFNILFQKPIDNANKVVLLEVNRRQYLVILGTSHLLLDSYDNQSITNEDGFESILRDNQQELDSYMKLSEDKPTIDPLQSYKEKASLEAYRSHM